VGVSLAEVVAYLDARLCTAETPDYPLALNGLQFANRGSVTRVAAAVDYSTAAVTGAVAAGADLLLVHHGMFWGGASRIVGAQYERFAALLAGNVAVYASHLPLDVHPEIGNNALIAQLLDLNPTAGFAKYANIEIGLRGDADVRTAVLVERMTALAVGHGGSLVTTPFQRDRVTRRWAICSGAGASTETLREASALGVDTLVVGEGPHHTAVQAIDTGIVVIYAGHYATETLGVTALARELATRFTLDHTFIAAPTGL
jgi:dinuclear metal center YbgI/SA1388 family protein